MSQRVKVFSDNVLGILEGKVNDFLKDHEDAIVYPMIPVVDIDGDHSFTITVVY